MTNWSEEKREETRKKTQRWINDCMETPAFKELTEREQENFDFGVDVFVNYIYDYENQIPETWTVRGLKNCCLNTLPRKVSIEVDFFEDLPIVLKTFFYYIQEKRYIKNGDKLGKAVMEIADEIVEKANDPDNWGMAKGFLMAALEAGVDPHDTDEMNHFMAAYNKRMQLNNYLEEEVEDKGRDINEVIDELPPSQLIDILPSMLDEEEMEKYQNEEFAEKTLDTFFGAMEREEDIEVVMKGFSPAQQAIVMGVLKEGMEEEGYDFDEILDEKPKKRGRIIPLRTTPKVGRNAPCPCGSGKKYKRCCGK